MLDSRQWQHENGLAAAGREKNIARCTTQGMNPFMIGQTEIEAILRNELLNDTRFATATDICFYGAGCRGEGCKTMERALRAVWPGAETLTVGSDLLGAARALCGTDDGIACIPGNGQQQRTVCGRQAWLKTYRRRATFWAMRGAVPCWAAVWWAMC